MNKIKNFLAFLMLVLAETAFITLATDGSLSDKPEDMRCIVIFAIILGIYLLYCIHAVFIKQKIEFSPSTVFKILFWPIAIILMFDKHREKRRQRREANRKMEEKFWEEYERWL